MKLKCSIIRVSPHDPEVQGTLISISQGWGAVWVGNRVHEYPLSRILIEEVSEELVVEKEVETIPDVIEPPVIKPQLTSKLKGTGK